MLAVRADGVITPCTMLSHIELGRINRDNLAKLWRRHSDLDVLRERTASRSVSFFLRGMSLRELLYRNCPGLSSAIIGVVNHPSPDACLRKFLAEGGRLPDRSLLC